MKAYHYFLLLFISFPLSNNIYAQQELSKTNIYAEGGFHFLGQASINIERKILNTEKLTWYGRVGYGVAGEAFGDEGKGLIGAITMLTGKRNKHFEVNGGFFVGKENYDDSTMIYPILNVGYRYQKPSSSFIFKAKAGCLGIGIGIGYGF